jgi:hypothetical protein
VCQAGGREGRHVHAWNQAACTAPLQAGRQAGGRAGGRGGRAGRGATPAANRPGPAAAYSTCTALVYG